MYLFVVCLLFVCWLQRMADTNGTLAFEDAQVIPPFSMENTDDRDDTDDKDDTDDTDNTYDTGDAGDSVATIPA